ncbi:F0F1 ATP synthase subunit delta [Candidatus Babeliales bacterium]|nr:F0F1 ATP synthase subunit delta [Candidatus Babeliales bacterium]
MNIKIYVIAKKYAIAFLNLYFDRISDKDIETICSLVQFLKLNKKLCIFLCIPSLSESVKKKVLIRVAEKFDLFEPLKKMMFVLLIHKRIEILEKVLEQVIIYYRERKCIKLFKITTSHLLSKSQKNDVVIFVEDMVKGKIVTKFFVNSKLICGFRIQSKNFLWERSISKQLGDVKKSIFKQVGLW